MLANWGNLTKLAEMKCEQQGLTGRVFQLRVGSGLGIEKIFRVGSSWVAGIFIKYQVNRVLSGIREVSPLFPIFLAALAALGLPWLLTDWLFYSLLWIQNHPAIQTKPKPRKNDGDHEKTWPGQEKDNDNDKYNDKDNDKYI